MGLYDDLYLPGAESTDVGTAGDFAKTFGAGALDVGANLAAGGRYMAEAGGNPEAIELARGLQELFSAGSGAISDTINPETRKLAQSTLTSEEFWERPILATALKTTGMLPNVAAMAIPGGLLTDVVGATMAAGAAGGALNAGSGLKEFYDRLDKVTDAELMEQSPKYAALREVFDEAGARRRFMREAEGWGPAINALLGAATGAIGPAGQAARGIVGGAERAVLGAGERGVLKTAGIGAAEGAVSEAIEEGITDINTQDALVQANFQQEMDLARAANAALEGGVLGGIFGGAVGGVAGVAKRPEKPKAPQSVNRTTRTLDKLDEVHPVATSDVAGPQVGNGRTGVPAAPIVSEQIGNPQNAPTRSSRDGAKEQKGSSTGGATVEVVQSSGPDAAQAAAVAANDQPAETTPAPAVPPAAALEQPGQTRSPVINAMTPPPEAPVAAPAAPAPAPAPLDTGMNVPEQPSSLAAQIAQIGQGERKAAMFPKGTTIPADALGGRKDLRKVTTSRGTFIYDPKLVTQADVRRLSKLGRENELLGLGPVSKPEAVASAAAGAAPVAVTERTPGGTEVKAAAGTTETLPAQVTSLEAQKTPGNVVRVETPENVLQMRSEPPAPVKRTGRVLPNLTQTDAPVVKLAPLTPAQLKKNEAEAAKARARAEAEAAGKPLDPEEEPVKKQGKKYSKAQIAENDAMRAKAAAVVVNNPPNPAEDGHLSNPEARDAVIRRARAMVEQAEANGVVIQSQLKKSIKGDALSDDPSIQILREAKDLVKVADKRKQGREITEATGRFATNERLIRAGGSDVVLAQRREEGDARMKRGPSAEDAALGIAAAPEVASEADTAASEGVEVISKDEGTSAGNEDADVDPEVKAKEKAESVAATPEARAREEQDKITTRSSSSRREVMLDDGTEKTEEGVTRAKAAGGDKLANDAERKAKLIAEMNAKYGLAPAKVKNSAQQAQRRQHPSQAQIAAGNYKKGHRRVEGLDFSIENPKGSTRYGFDEDAEELWHVTMPADYGYIRRTEGADGDHVDAYDGRVGRRFFVVDQLDLRTGEFDEHKVMMRFRDEAHARETYIKAFSDGNGAARLGYIHEVTPAELKEWLRRGDTTAPHAEHVVDGPATLLPLPTGDFPPLRIGKVRLEGTDKDIEVVRSSTLGDELAKTNFNELPGVGGVISPFMANRLTKLASDVEVHYVTEEQMNRATMEPAGPGEDVALGLHNTGGGKSQIFLLDDLEEGANWEQRGQVLLHEAVHAVTVREIANVPRAQETIAKLARTAWDYMHANDIEVKLRYAQPGGSDPISYGFTNPYEFVAEAFSNPHFQDFLARVPIDKELARFLGLKDTSRVPTVWDVFRNFVKRTIAKITGVSPNFDSVLDGVMRVGEHLTSIHGVDTPSVARDTNAPAQLQLRSSAKGIMDGATTAVTRALNAPQVAGGAPNLLKWRTFDNIAQIADHFFGESNPVRKIHEAIEAIRVEGERIFQKSEPIINRLIELRAKDAEQYREFSSLLHDATVANVHPDVPLSDARNAHLGKNALRGVWSKARHRELSARFNELDEDFKAAWHQTVKHFTDRQNAMSLSIIENQVLKLFGIEDAALARRIHEGNLTDADRSLLGKNLEVIEKAGELAKIDGPYVPLMRRGDHVVKGDYKVTRPGNAKPVHDGAGNVIPNQFEFTSRKEAEDYAARSPLQASIDKVWVDPATGSTLRQDGSKVAADDLDSVDRYRVEVQNRHVEFVQGKRAALARAAELAQDGSIAVHEVVPRDLEPNARQGTELSTALEGLVGKLKRSSAYQDATPTQRATLRQAIEEAALASHGSTRISSRALPRRNVKGFSEDLIQNTADYGSSSSRYLAKLEYATELEDGLREMKETLGRDHSKTGQYARTAISNEVRTRIESDNGFQDGGKFAPVVKRAMAISFLDKLVSPAYSIINALQPSMVTMPYLAGKHGTGRTFSALGNAYRDIGAGQVFRSGLVETAKKLRASRNRDDFIGAIRGRLSGDERAMFDEHVRVGTIDPGAGMEISELVRDTSGLSGKADAVLGYLEGVGREMPRAVEAVNRSVAALAAYRLERSRGASHADAVRYSKDVVNSTQFNYSPTNSPAIFNHPLAKVALQFKKYGQGIYQLIGTQVAYAIRNEKPGDRAQAVKTLITLAGTHMAMAGALGLPTEPFKYLLAGAQVLGLTGMGWSDVEDKIRRAAAGALGTTGGEVFTRGLPRLLNIDLARMGLDSVTSFGEPRSLKENDVKMWLFDTLAGPVAALGGEWVKGLNNAANGDLQKAAEQLIPLKAVSDVLRAYRQTTEGKKSATGRETLSPYGMGEAGLRSLGFGNAREAESSAQRSSYYRNTQRDKDTRAELMTDWVTAKPEGKAKAMAKITKYNQGVPAEAKITMKELTAKLKRDQKVATEGTRGILPGKRDKRFLEEGIYNTR